MGSLAPKYYIALIQSSFCNWLAIFGGEHLGVYSIFISIWLTIFFTLVSLSSVQCPETSLINQIMLSKAPIKYENGKRQRKNVSPI